MILEDDFSVIALGIRPPDFFYIRQNKTHCDPISGIKQELEKNTQVMGSKTRREPPLL